MLAYHGKTVWLKTGRTVKTYWFQPWNEAYCCLSRLEEVSVTLTISKLSKAELAVAKGKQAS